MSQTLSATLDVPRPAPRFKSLPAPVLCALAVLALAHVPLLVAHFRLLSLKPHYEFYPLVFLGAAVLAIPAWRLFRAGSAPSPIERKVGLILLGLNWLMLLAAAAIESPWVGMVSFWELLIAVALLSGGAPVLRAAVPGLIFLLIIIPPPLNLDGKLVTSLQVLTSKVSGRVLDYIPVIHFSEGNTVEIAGKKYFVDKACSGINSLFSTLAVTLFYILWTGTNWLRSIRPWVWAILLLLAAVFWDVIANIIRVSFIVWLDSKFAIDLSKDGWNWEQGSFYQHTMLGFALFGLTLLMVASTDRFLKFLGTAVRWGEEPSATPDAVAAPSSGPRASAISWGAVMPVVAAYGVLAVVQFGERQFRVAITEPPYVQAYNSWTVDSMPAEIDSWQRQSEFTFESRDSDNFFGAHSRTWRYQAKNGLTAVVSFDYPFPEWHDLRMCYKGIGWREEQSEVFPHKVKGGELDCVRFELVKPFELRGYGWFTEFDPSGKPVTKAEVTVLPNNGAFDLNERLTSMRDRWSALFSGNPLAANEGEVLQVQVLVEHFGPLPAAEKEQVEKFFLKAAELVRLKCAADSAGK
jgi:exosortase